MRKTMLNIRGITIVELLIVVSILGGFLYARYYQMNSAYVSISNRIDAELVAWSNETSQLTDGDRKGLVRQIKDQCGSSPESLSCTLYFNNPNAATFHIHEEELSSLHTRVRDVVQSAS